MEHSKDLDEAFHHHIKEFICSTKFFSKLEENEHARHFYLENNVVKVSLNYKNHILRTQLCNFHKYVNVTNIEISQICNLYKWLNFTNV